MQNAHNTVSLLDLSDRWEMMQSAQVRLEDAKVAARAAKRAEFEALRAFEEARQTYQLMLARQAKGGDK
jgi:hypothetical protein